MKFATTFSYFSFVFFFKKRRDSVRFFALIVRIHDTAMAWCPSVRTKPLVTGCQLGRSTDTYGKGPKDQNPRGLDAFKVY